MPRRIVIQPSVREYGAHRERYGTLVAELQTEDVLVRLVSPSGNLAQHGEASRVKLMTSSSTWVKSPGRCSARTR
jgi:hypothetical protein